MQDPPQSPVADVAVLYQVVTIKPGWLCSGVTVTIVVCIATVDDIDTCWNALNWTSTWGMCYQDLEVSFTDWALSCHTYYIGQHMQTSVEGLYLFMSLMLVHELHYWGMPLSCALWCLGSCDLPGHMQFYSMHMNLLQPHSLTSHVDCSLQPYSKVLWRNSKKVACLQLQEWDMKAFMTHMQTTTCYRHVQNSRSQNRATNSMYMLGDSYRCAYSCCILNSNHVCNGWDAYMGFTNPMTTKAEPFNYNVLLIWCTCVPN